MGYNSLLFLCNDAMSAIDDDPVLWWREARHYLTEALMRPNERHTFGFNAYSNYFQATWCRHADETGLIAVGGNFTSVVGTDYFGASHHDQESQIKLISRIVDKMGYKLIKKRE